MYELHTPTLVVRADHESESQSSYANLGMTVRALPGFILPVFVASSRHIRPEDDELLAAMINVPNAPLIVRCLDELGLFVLIPFGGNPELLYAQREELLGEKLSLAYVELLGLAHASGAQYLLTGGDFPVIPGLPDFFDLWK